MSDEKHNTTESHTQGQVNDAELEQVQGGMATKSFAGQTFRCTKCAHTYRQNPGKCTKCGGDISYGSIYD